jgi:hypothetical protein
VADYSDLPKHFLLDQFYCKQLNFMLGDQNTNPAFLVIKQESTDMYTVDQDNSFPVESNLKNEFLVLP